MVAPMWTKTPAIEVFHLLFRNFRARVDKALFALKGGCNLRFRVVDTLRGLAR